MLLKMSCRRPGEFARTIQDPTIKPTGVVLINYQEWEYTSIGDNPSFEGLVDYVNEHNVPLYIINGSAPMPPLFDDTQERYKNVQPIIYWPTYFMTNWYGPFRDNVNYTNAVNTDDTLDFNQDFKYLYISLNNKPHRHRCMLMDILYKNGLLDKGAVSWNSWNGDIGRDLDQHTGYEWKYWKPELKLLDDITPEKRVVNRGWETQLPEQYKHAFVQIISETSDRIPIISEKTIPCLLLNKLFLVSGCVHFHKLMKSLGFELYDEIFDYSFDDEPDSEKRFEMLTQNLVKLKDCSEAELRELYNKVRHKIVHNKKHVIKLAKDINLFPKLLLDMCKKDDPFVIVEDAYTFYHQYKDAQ